MFYPSKGKKGGNNTTTANHHGNGRGGNDGCTPQGSTSSNGSNASQPQPNNAPKDGAQPGEVRHTGPKQKTPTQLEQIPYYKEPLGGMPTLTPCPTEGTPCDAPHSRRLANRKTEEKEPTRVVNLRRRLLRILTTRDRIMESETGQPDSRQLSALNAEAPIVWEINQWEEHRIIYPGKEEQRWLPPNSLTPHLQQNPAQDREGNGSVTTATTRTNTSSTGDTEGCSSRSSSGGPMARVPVSLPPPSTEGSKKPEAGGNNNRAKGRGGGSNSEISTKSHVEVWMQTVSQESGTEEWHHQGGSRPHHPTTQHGAQPAPTGAPHGGTPPFTPPYGPVFVPSSHPPPPPAYHSHPHSLPRPPYPRGPSHQEECSGMGGTTPYPSSGMEEGEVGSSVGSLSGPMSPGQGSYGSMYGNASSYSLQHPQQQQMFVAPMVHDYDAFHIPPHTHAHNAPSNSPSQGGGGSTTIPPSPSAGGKGPGDCPAPATAQVGSEEQHSLESTWSVWFDNSPGRAQGGHGRGSTMDRQSYEDSMVMAGTFSTIQGFWAFWNNVGVEHLRDNFNLKIFRYGIRPTWEDAHNSRGGRWVARGLPRTRRQNLWLTVVLNMVGELLEDNTADTVNGVVLSTKDSQGDCVQIWMDGGHHNRTVDGEGASAPEYRANNLPMQEVLKEMYASEQETSFSYSLHGAGKGAGGPGSPAGRRRGNGGRNNNRKDGVPPSPAKAVPASPKAPPAPTPTPAPAPAKANGSCSIPGAHAPSPTKGGRPTPASPASGAGSPKGKGGRPPQPPLDLLIPLEARPVQATV